MTPRWLLLMLAERCEPLRAAIASRDSEVARDVEFFRPGGIRNRDLTAFGQAIYYVALRHALAHLEAAVKPHARGEEESAIRLLAALVDEPGPIDTTGLIRVYPKSIDALQAIIHFARHLESESEEERTLAYELIGWCATYAAPSLPFSDTASIPPLPVYVRALGQERLKRIFVVLRLLHEDRIDFLNSIMPVERFQVAALLATEGGKYAQLLDQLSEQLDLPAKTLSRNHSLPSLIALAVVANEMHDPPPARGAALLS